MTESRLTLEARGLRKSYSSAREGFSLGRSDGGVSFSVPEGELFALVGPSGCGKTTTLRILGGFLAPDAGSVLVDGVDVTGRPPHRRPTNTVFQSYALFPHLSVGSNVEFGLAVERVGRKERRERAAEALELVGLAGMQDRRVPELSGGQQQRAALARALVKRPRVLLLDEPLGSLDLKLRRQMQDELARLKTSTSTTFVHVTHDQEEACAIADRIAVMRDGDIVQVDSPYELFRRPRTTYVASFLDAGTIVRGRATRSGDVVEIAGEGLAVRAPVVNGSVPDRAAAVVPPDKIRVGAGGDGVAGVVSHLTFTGAFFVAHVEVASGLEFKVHLPVERRAELGGTVDPGSRVALGWRPEDVILVEDAD